MIWNETKECMSREEMTNTAIVCREKFITNGTVSQEATTITATPRVNWFFK